jgi:hypothetical protein
MVFSRSRSRGKPTASCLAAWIVVAVVAGTVLPALVSSPVGDPGATVATPRSPAATSAQRAVTPSGPGLVSLAAFSGELRSGGLPTRPGGSVTYGTAVDYLSADSAALVLASGYAGGGWTPWFVVGFANNRTTFLGLPKGSTSCPVTWIETPPAHGWLVFPPTSPQATPGTSAGWGFILGQTSGSSLLFDAVVNGTATLVLTLPVGCFNLASNQAIPAGVVNSTTAAAAAGLVGGSGFLAEFPGANRTYELVSNSTSPSAPNLWGVTYTTPVCENAHEGEFDAVIYALNGTVASTYSSVSACAYSVEFGETGLTNGTDWSVAVNGSMHGAAAPTPVSYDLPNGSYTFQVFAPAGYRATPLAGTFNVTSAPVRVAVVFALLAGNFSVTFTEHGVPNGSALWQATLRNATGASSFGVSNGGTSVSFAAPNGTYNFTIDVQTSGWAAVPSSGQVTVAGANVSVLIAFVPGFVVTFAESGLPPGISWSVNVNGTPLSTQGTEINISEPNGSYPFAVSPPTGFRALPSSGSVGVDGTPIVQRIVFVIEPGYYALTFSERGLPAGSSWIVNLRNSSGVYSFAPANGRTRISFGEPNGSYTYSVDVGAAGWGPSPDAGAVSIVGANVTVLLRFAPGFLVTFTESGLSPGTFWAVTLNGSGSSTTGDQITYTEPNGSYAFAVQVPSGYLAFPAIGRLSVNGVAIPEAIVFSPVSAGSTVTFTATGLPSGTSWWVNLTTEPALGTTTTTITVELPNGSYTYTVASANKQFAAPGGSFGVSGTPVPVSVTFAPVTFEVTFEETGLPIGTLWWVNGTVLGSLESTGTTITVPETNGTYAYSVATADKEYAALGGSLEVNGGPATEPVTFAVVTYAVTFTATGLPPGTEWWVNVTGQSALSSMLATISTALPNGSYTFTVASADKQFAAAGAALTVSGAVVSESVTFHLVTYAVTFTESGLPGGAEWWVNGTALGTHSSTTTTLVVNEPNGSYPYLVATSDKEYAATGGPLVVSGGPVPKAVTFGLVTYAVTFTESGLPAGTNWSVGLGAVVHYATTTTITFHEPNGTYAFAPENLSGYSVSPSPVAVQVHGGAQSRAVTYAATPKGATLFGLPATEAYAVIGGIVALAVVAGVTTTLVRNRRRAASPPPPDETPPAGESPPGPS